MELFTIPLMAFLARACGASWKPPGAEWVFALPFGVVAYLLAGNPLLAVIGYFVTYLGMQLGHGNFYKMVGVNPTRDNPEKIEKLIRPIFTKLGGKLYNPFYSWVCMGVKGLIIGLAAFPFGFTLAVLWPLAYWLGWRIWNGTLMGEWLSGAFAGLVLYNAIFLGVYNG